MQILLINTNPIVSKLITLCAQDKGAILNEVRSLEEIGQQAYDLVFIDDGIYQGTSLATLAALETREIILLSKEQQQVASPVSKMVKKPFLPSRIYEILDHLSSDESVEEKEMKSIIDDIKSENLEHANEILDLHEIEKIKSLLDMEEPNEIEDEPIWEDAEAYELHKREVIKQNLIEEGLEIVEEDDVIHAIDEKEELSLHITHDLDRTFEDKLLDALRHMKVKKIKKLLKDAHITIDIRFKDEHA